MIQWYARSIIPGADAPGYVMSALSGAQETFPDSLSEDVHGEVHALVELLLLPVVPAVGVAEEAEDPVAAVLVAIVRALDLRDDPLFARIAIPAVVQSVILEAVAGDLRR